MSSAIASRIVVFLPGGVAYFLHDQRWLDALAVARDARRVQGRPLHGAQHFVARDDREAGQPESVIPVRETP